MLAMAAEHGVSAMEHGAGEAEGRRRQRQRRRSRAQASTGGGYIRFLFIDGLALARVHAPCDQLWGYRCTRRWTKAWPHSEEEDMAPDVFSMSCSV